MGPTIDTRHIHRLGGRTLPVSHTCLLLPQILMLVRGSVKEVVVRAMEKGVEAVGRSVSEEGVGRGDQPKQDWWLR